ncbi:hypothetical protein GBAR_LOCUS14196 [Geodia barretti]|uniref:Uncharacterized protein n=1 Tax=Geodia barretti TaxID=519541 RepID=A0AA35WS57_GEOBA|nr:hypothetical protein GBAR_LOCUS14196 [Geodia barretti]
MVQCWHPDKSCRPSFPSLSRHLGLPVSQLLHWSTEEVTGVGPQGYNARGSPQDWPQASHDSAEHLPHTAIVRLYIIS